jgi:hypothetical protein
MATSTTFSQWYPFNTGVPHRNKIQWHQFYESLASILVVVLGLTLFRRAFVYLMMELYEYFIQKNMLKL